jgi:hypothetical protein
MAMRLLFGFLILFALVTAKAAPAPALELGVQDDPVLLTRSYGSAELALQRAADMGASRVRVNLIWSHVMSPEAARAKRRPAGLTWDFTNLERLYADAAAHGLELQVTLAGPAPAWATGNRKIGYTRPRPAAFAEFAGAAATAFAGRIDRWSIWNEPNWHRLLQPTKRAPAIYRALFRQGAAAVRAADPAAAVLIGEMMPGRNPTASTPVLRFLRRVACDTCRRLTADGFALHPYFFAGPPKQARASNPDIVEIGTIGRLTRALDALRAKRRLVTPSGARMPVYLTEFGYFTTGPVRVSRARHAKWMKQAWNLVRRNRRVRQLLQYQLFDPWPRDVRWRTAVLNRDGSPRPAYRALAELASSSAGR